MIPTTRMESDERIGEAMEPSRGKVTRSGTFGNYEVTGWRYSEEAAWHVKVWLTGRPGDWIGYTVTDGHFGPGTVAEAAMIAVLHLIAKWQALVAPRAPAVEV
jgi:hypothetical protein